MTRAVIESWRHGDETAVRRFYTGYRWWQARVGGWDLRCLRNTNLQRDTRRLEQVLSGASSSGTPADPSLDDLIRPEQKGAQSLDHLICSKQEDCGILRPRAFAVLRLMTSSNFVGWSIGRSPGLAPLRILSP
jgi:hypothetical protein